MKRLILALFTVFPLSLSWAEELLFCGVEWPPFTYADDDSLTKGISIDIYDEAFSRLGMSYRADAIPWPRCLQLVENGSYDAVIDNGSFDPYIHGSHATSFYPLALYVREDFQASEFSWEGITGETVGMVRGYDYTPKVKSFEGWEVQISRTDEHLLKMLKLERVDYVLLDIFSANILSENVGLKIKKMDPLVDSSPLYLVFNQTKQALVKQYDAVISEMIDDGTMNTIYKKYFSTSYSELSKVEK